MLAGLSLRCLVGWFVRSVLVCLFACFDRLFGWLIGRLVVCLVGCLAVGLVGRLAGLLVCWCVSRSFFGSLVGCIVDSLVVFVISLVGVLFSLGVWLVGCFVSWLVDCLVVRLVR